MKRVIFIVFCLSISLIALSQSRNTKLTLTGQYKEVAPDRGLGLDNIYVFKTLGGATVSYTTSSSNTLNIYTYETDYISNRIPVPTSDITITSLGSTDVMYTVSNLQDNRGLVFVDNNQAKAFWIVDYGIHKPVLRQIYAEESGDRCEMLKLIIDKDDILEYRGTSGQVREIDRRYDVSYERLKWDTDQFISNTITMEDLSIGTEIILDEVPNMNTQFLISGDQFGKDFGIPEKLTSNIYEAVAVEAQIITKQHSRDADNEKNEGEKLGGSAPVEIDFFGYSNEPVADYSSWYIFNKKDMKNPVARYNDQDMSYTFEQDGDYLVRFEVANTASSCVDSVSVSLNVSISFLDIPNYFSPRNTPGSNDEFKVAYKSIIKFKCTIFNRWGNKIYEWTDPAQGWDGRYKGSFVNPGVYYYVIEATGSDGKKYKKGGDINIL